MFHKVSNMSYHLEYTMRNKYPSDNLNLTSGRTIEYYNILLFYAFPTLKYSIGFLNKIVIFEAMYYYNTLGTDTKFFLIIKTNIGWSGQFYWNIDYFTLS